MLFIVCLSNSNIISNYKKSINNMGFTSIKNLCSSLMTSKELI